MEGNEEGEEESGDWEADEDESEDWEADEDESGRILSRN